MGPMGHRRPVIRISYYFFSSSLKLQRMLLTLSSHSISPIKICTPKFLTENLEALMISASFPPQCKQFWWRRVVLIGENPPETCSQCNRHPHPQLGYLQSRPASQPLSPWDIYPRKAGHEITEEPATNLAPFPTAR